MTDFPIMAIGFILNLIAVLFVICCVVLILIILVQKGKGGGLSSAFGGGASGGILGTKTGDFLTWVTIVLVGIMLFFAVILAKFYKPVPKGSVIPGIPATQTAPATTSSTTTTQPLTNSGGESVDSTLPMTTETGMMETGMSVEDTMNEVDNVVETSDVNQAGN